MGQRVNRLSVKLKDESFRLIIFCCIYFPGRTLVVHRNAGEMGAAVAAAAVAMQNQARWLSTDGVRLSHQSQKPAHGRHALPTVLLSQQTACLTNS